MKLKADERRFYGDFAREVERLLNDKKVHEIFLDTEWVIGNASVDFMDCPPVMKKGQLGYTYTSNNRIMFILYMGKRLGYFTFFQKYVNRGDVFVYDCIFELQAFFFSDQLFVKDFSRIYTNQNNNLYTNTQKLIDLYRVKKPQLPTRKSSNKRVNKNAL